MVKVGDSVEVATRKIGQTPRTGMVTAVSGALITVRWDSGDETSLIPAGGSLTVVGAVRSSGTEKSPARPAARETQAAKSTPKKATPKKRPAKKAPKGR